jgi:hypothetical protein
MWAAIAWRLSRPGSCANRFRAISFLPLISHNLFAHIAQVRFYIAFWPVKSSAKLYRVWQAASRKIEIYCASTTVAKLGA